MSSARLYRSGGGTMSISIRAAATVTGVLAATLLTATPAHARAPEPPRWSVTGPHGGPTASVRYDAGAGTVAVAVTRAGQTVLEPGPVGIVTEGADLATGLRFTKRTDHWVFEHYTTTVGKRTHRTASMREARFSFTNAGGARVDLVVRASRDGIAYRYELAGDYGAVVRETSAFAVPDDSPAWLATYSVYYENPFVPTTAGGAAAGEFMHPALFQTPGGYVLLTESDVDGRYSGGRLVHDA